MKIVVIGGSGLIGSKLVTLLRERGDEAVPASRSSGVNSITREGLAEALKGAAAVVGVTKPPSWEDAAVMKFFETSTRNLLTLWGGRRCKTSCRVVSRGNGTSAHERFLPRKNGPGEFD
jgi:NAD(P)-dependent dehydrogenase (short-subunit alcohol dehydrogenase family)